MTSRILLVEDEFLIRVVLGEALQDAGFEIAEADDSDAAADLVARDRRIDLLVTDIQMPGRLDGIGLGALIRAYHPGIPIIYTTGRPDTMAVARLGPCEAFIAKPYPPSEIVGVARRLLGEPTIRTV